MLNEEIFAMISHTNPKEVMMKNSHYVRMIKVLTALPLLLLLILIPPGCKKGEEAKNPSGAIEPPVAKIIPKELTALGDTRIDNYYWLNQRDNPDVMAYLEAENAYKDAMMAHTKGLQEKLFQEIVGRIKKTDMSVPTLDQGYYRYTRYEEEREYPIHCRKKGSLDSEEEIVLDVNKMAEGHDYYSVAGYSTSPSNDLIAYGVDTVSRRLYTLHFKDLKTGKIFDEKIPNTSGRAAWANDNKTVFYMLKDITTLRPYKVMKHEVGTPVSNDQEIYVEEDVTFNTSVHKTKSKKYLIISSTQTLSSESRYLDADNPDGQFQIIQPREKDHEYDVEHFQDKFYILTNWQAKNFRLMETPVDKTTKENWKEVIPHRKDVYLQSMEIFKDHLVLGERKEGLRQIRVIKWEDGSDYYINFGEEAYAAYISKNPSFDTPLLRYSYTSLVTPESIYDFNMDTKEKNLLKQEEVLGDFDTGNYVTERHHATARDGTKIPISLVYKKGLEKDGSNPLLLHGYGSYGSSREPSFSSVRLSLLDRGFAYAIPHIRGGGEMGYYWYEEGKLFNKKNTFTDFIDCAEYLIEQKFTNPDKLFAMGGSAGGLLMGAVVNMRPDLWKGVLAAVPFVDVITTMIDPSIPLTSGEWDEWGDPRQKDYYDYMLSYSPYDNVEAKDYPAMLVTTGFHDSQVQYFEPAKWVAKLRALKTDDNPLIFHINMEGGHGGVSGRFRRHRETALEYAFMLDLVGIKE